MPVFPHQGLGYLHRRLCLFLFEPWCLAGGLACNASSIIVRRVKQWAGLWQPLVSMPEQETNKQTRKPKKQTNRDSLCFVAQLISGHKWPSTYPRREATFADLPVPHSLSDFPTSTPYPGVHFSMPFPLLSVSSAPHHRLGHTQPPSPSFPQQKADSWSRDLLCLLYKPTYTLKALRNAINYNNSDTLYFYSLFHQKISEYLKNIISLILTTPSWDSWQVSPSRFIRKGNEDRKVMFREGARIKQKELEALWFLHPGQRDHKPNRGASHLCIVYKNVSGPHGWITNVPDI